METVVIAGLGLIGGSLARNIHTHQDVHLIGVDQRESTLAYALQHHIIDEAMTSFQEAASKADIILLAAPVSKSVELLLQLDSIDLQKDVLVTDVSSVKGPIFQQAAALRSDRITFVGGHPMAGSHKQGIEASKAHLFENAIYVMTPVQQATDVHIDRLKQLLSGTKSTFITLSAEEHDEMTGVVSHFPHFIASALVQQAKKWEAKHSFLPKLAAGGFRDITRIASSNPGMWQDIFFQNKEKMAVLLDDWIREMQTFRTLLAEDKREEIHTYLTDAKSYRDGLEPRKKGAIPGYYDLYVDITDQPGALQKVLAVIADAGLSIVNIQILELREGLTGVLRLSFAEQKMQLKAKGVLEVFGYEVKIQD
ncbi:prephenate dehydrogenase [Terribacillus sp. DMT04]|uniref:prephenate dehydrogenase n=1 Tax=Terribacillus sp. DMT04 TaxID=2850441 RepID=UPI001C2BD91B|nr:prephenate dehydrogenase [Terribacillus sp. DMT04]QXE00270.1 prephenate dehydrogenase [Terribacillus sp. DMT04]